MPSRPSARTEDAFASEGDLRAFERWREESLASKLFDVDVDPIGFRNDFQRSWLGDTPVMAFTQTGAGYMRSRERVRRDGVDSIWVQCMDTGGLDGRHEGGTLRVGARMSSVCDLGRPVEQQTHASTGRIVVLPRDTFDGSALDRMHGAVIDGARHEILCEHLRWLAEAPPPGREVDGARLASSIAAVVVACLDPQAKTPEAAVPALVGATLRRVLAYVDARLDDPDLSVGQIARAVGVSRASLYRVCVGQGGVSSLIWERRLQALRAALSDPARPGRIHQIAADCGFSTASHASVSFKERFGFSPRNLRPF